VGILGFPGKMVDLIHVQNVNLLYGIYRKEKVAEVRAE